LPVDDAERVADRRRARGLDAEAHELEVARVGDLALVDLLRAGVAEVVRRARVRVAVLGQA
jgi:hypothetical protein